MLPDKVSQLPSTVQQALTTFARLRDNETFPGFAQRRWTEMSNSQKCAFLAETKASLIAEVSNTNREIDWIDGLLRR